MRASASTRLYRAHLLGPGPSEGVRVSWLGTAGLLIQDRATSFLVDPFVSRPGLLRVALRRPLPPRLDLVERWLAWLGPSVPPSAVLVTHSHYDHAMDAPLFARCTGARLVGSESTANIGRGAGLPASQIEVLGGGGLLQLGLFRVRLLTSEHGPALLGRVPYPGHIDRPLVPPATASAYRLGGTLAIHIEHPRLRLVHHGSAGFRAGMYQGLSADTLLLGLAGRGALQPYLRATVDELGARRLIPIHFDDFFRPLPAAGQSLPFLPGVGFAEFMRRARHGRPRLELATLPLGPAVPL